MFLTPFADLFYNLPLTHFGFDNFHFENLAKILAHFQYLRWEKGNPIFKSTSIRSHHFGNLNADGRIFLGKLFHLIKQDCRFRRHQLFEMKIGCRTNKLNLLKFNLESIFKCLTFFGILFNLWGNRCENGDFKILKEENHMMTCQFKAQRQKSYA